ncbi:MAG TPA: ABC transporter permease [Fimbriimonadales bacterium]|jgi:ribose transport system permease protein|nr:ABC transporter permease [Fimbriimonadales bacterium]
MRKFANLLGLAVAWALVFGLFSFFVPNSFPTVGNLETLARQTTIVGFAAIGMTYIIISGAIDLSVGSMVALVTVMIAWLQLLPCPPAVAAIGGIVAGLLAGALNGFLTTRLKVGSFIITLGSLLMIRGIAKGIAHEQKIDAPLTWLSDLLATLGPHQKWMLLPIGVWMLIVLAIVASLILNRTVFGRNVIAVGGNEEAARLCGIGVAATRTWVFALGGLFTGLAGLMQFSRLTVGDPTVAQGLELDVIAAVVIGGGSLSGGQGSIAGSLLGAIIMSTIRAGTSQMGLPNWVQEIVTGAIIVVAVALDRWRMARAGHVAA